MLLFKLFKKKKTAEQRMDEQSEKWCDFLLSKYQYNGRFAREDLRSKRTDLKPTAEEEKIYENAAKEWFPTLTGYMIQKGYFYDDEVAQEYKLTERGNLAKELGSIKKFKRFRKKEILARQTQAFVNGGLVLAAFLSCVMPFVASKCNSKPTIINSVQSQPMNNLDTQFLSHYIDAKLLRIISTQQQPPPRKAKQTKRAK